MRFAREVAVAKRSRQQVIRAQRTVLRYTDILRATPEQNPDWQAVTHRAVSGCFEGASETPEGVYGRSANIIRRQIKVAASEKIKVRLRSYESSLIDASAKKIVEVAKRNGAEVSGPIPLPTEKEIITILRAVHKYKDSREQFEQRTHKRLIEIRKPSKELIDALMHIELPAGVDIDVKI